MNQVPLLQVANTVEEIGKFYGQEINYSSYNIARMNMLLHGLKYSDFDIKPNNSLENPQKYEFKIWDDCGKSTFSARLFYPLKEV